jgi:hypothetical protein
VVPSNVLTDRLGAHRSEPRPFRASSWDSYPKPLRSGLVWLRGLSPEWRDVFLYSCSTVFAGLTAVAAGIPLYRAWGQMAVGFYALAAALMALVAWRVKLGADSRGQAAATPGASPTPVAPEPGLLATTLEAETGAGPGTQAGVDDGTGGDGPTDSGDHVGPAGSQGTDGDEAPATGVPGEADGGGRAEAGWPSTAGTPWAPRHLVVLRVVAFLIVLFGATVLPLSMEVIWRSEGNAALHVQPEVLVVEQAGTRAADGKDPYRVIDRNGHIVIHESTEPIYELYYPYLPGMVIFGFSRGSKVEARLTDARIQFLVFTTLVTVLALWRMKPRTDARIRSFEVMTALPTAALPLATGGDDMPVVALMLLGLCALQRRRPFLAGLALGAAASLKFTSWAVVVFALWAAYDLKAHRAIGRYVLGVVAVAGPVVLPVALQNPSAFIDNVVRFPLGLAGVSSPAASALPGHELVAAFPSAHKAYVAIVGVVGLAILVRYLMKRPPRNPAEVARLTGWFMLIAILLAPATRVGYLLYPINLFVWAWMLRRSEDPGDPIGPLESPLGEDLVPVASG